MEKLAAIKALASIILEHFILGMARDLRSGRFIVLPFMIFYFPVALIYLGVVYVFMLAFWIVAVITEQISKITNRLIKFASHLAENTSDNIITLIVYPVILAFYLPLLLVILILPKTIEHLDIDT